MKIVFDTNILLDSILDRPNRELALKLMYAVATEKVEGVVSANSITDLYDISRKGLGDSRAWDAVAAVLEMFDIAPVDGDACFMALTAGMADYEDAVLAVCASIAQADLIVTRDEGFVAERNSPVRAVKPEEALMLIEGADE